MSEERKILGAEKSPEKKAKQKKNIISAVIALLAVGLFVVFLVKGQKNKHGSLIKDNEAVVENSGPLNEGPVSPISGLPCENWNRRPIAVMQPGDVDARPVAGFSEADMVIEMPVITASITRLMGVYLCNTPKEVGSMRSARHDFIHLAKGLDAIFVPWGRSEAHGENDSVGLAKGILNRNEIDNINCNQDAGKSSTLCSDNPCFRKQASGTMRGVDTGYGDPAKFYTCAKELGYRMENNFSGYPHQQEAPLNERPNGGVLKVKFAGKYEVQYTYDKETNSYLRTWGGVADTDRNNGQRLAPKNVVVLIARSDQIEGQYNNVQLGDPWYDESDGGEAKYYMDGKEFIGTWKKNKSDIGSKLIFYNDKKEEIKFVPGQIWVEILEPGQGLRWEPNAQATPAQ